MLDAAGVSYEAVKPEVDEAAAKARMKNADEIASQLAAAKALSIKNGGWTIAATASLASTVGCSTSLAAARMQRITSDSSPARKCG